MSVKSLFFTLFKWLSIIYSSLIWIFRNFEFKFFLIFYENIIVLFCAITYEHGKYTWLW
jgi:hypothetical protein